MQTRLGAAGLVTGSSPVRGSIMSPVPSGGLCVSRVGGNSAEEAGEN